MEDKEVLHEILSHCIAQKNIERLLIQIIQKPAFAEVLSKFMRALLVNKIITRSTFADGKNA